MKKDTTPCLPYSDKEGEIRRLTKHIERLQEAYDNNTTRNAYRLGERLRVNKAKLALLQNNVVSIERAGYSRKEIVWSAATKKTLTQMAQACDISVKEYIEQQLTLMASKGMSFETAWQDKRGLEIMLHNVATASLRFVEGFEGDEANNVRELLILLRSMLKD